MATFLKITAKTNRLLFHHHRSLSVSSSFGPYLNSSFAFHLLTHRNFSSDVSGAFADRVSLRVTGGRGGDGCMSFTKGPNQEVAPPDGGRGGNGGHVWIEADTHCHSLRQGTTHVRAQSGTPGQSAKRRGKDGNDVVIRVPCGTVIREIWVNPTTEFPSTENENNENRNRKGELENGVTLYDLDTSKPHEIDRMIRELEESIKSEEEKEQQQQQQHQKEKQQEKQHQRTDVIAELNSHGQKILVASGGIGGKGNSSFKTSTNRTPLRYGEGTSGEHRRLELELKTIADVGLVGLPNAGKSTLLRSMSRARPKVAAYPFTTLRPHIGMVSCHSDYSTTPTTISVADIPGLIEGAHNDKGLGHDFLKHIERTRLLIYVIDVAQGAKQAIQSLTILNQELQLYNHGELSKRHACIVANKMDIQHSTTVHALQAVVDRVGEQYEVFPVSAKYGTGIEDVIQYIGKCVQKMKLQKQQLEQQRQQERLSRVGDDDKDSPFSYLENNAVDDIVEDAQQLQQQKGDISNR